MRRRFYLAPLLAACLTSLTSFIHAEPIALNLGPAHPITHPWSIELGIGYGQYQNMFQSDGSTPLARLGLGKELLQWKRLRAGLEAAFQTGNNARLACSRADIDALGGMPIDTVMKPTLDFLLTGKLYPEIERPAFLLVKGGLILRRLQFSRGSISDLTRVNPELQLGAGIDLSPLASLSLAYQRIQGSNPNLRVSMADGSAAIAGIPSEDALVLGLSFYLI